MQPEAIKLIKKLVKKMSKTKSGGCDSTRLTVSIEFIELLGYSFAFIYTAQKIKTDGQNKDVLRLSPLDMFLACS